MFIRNFRAPLIISFGLLWAAPSTFAAGLIFDADFDAQTNWAPEYAGQSYRNSGDTFNSGASNNLPGKFDYYYMTERWHPNGVESGGKKVLSKEPVGQISNQVSRSKSGKSFIVYDESYGSNGQWGSDAVLTKDLGAEYPELWLGVWIKFDPKWVWADQVMGANQLKGSWQSMMKLLRCRRHSGITTQDRFSFFGADARSGSPVAILDLKSWTTPSGNFVRPLLVPRGYTHPDTHKTEDDHYLFGGEYPRQFESYVRSDGGKALSWQELFLDDRWHEINLYLKMDSTPGSKDGIAEVWIDGQKVISANDVPWRKSGDPEMIGWNECSIGGNAHNIPFAEEIQYEQWYAVDDFKIYSGRPNTPRPPSNLKITIE